MIRTLLLALIMTIASADFSGDWTMKSASLGESVVEVPPGAVTLTLILEANGYKAAFKAGNHMLGGMIVEDEISDVQASVHFTSFTSTRMMPPPQLRQAESFISKSMSLMTLVTINDDGDLEMEGPDVKALFSPADGDQDNA
jgi:hypothetical protein